MSVHRPEEHGLALLRAVAQPSSVARRGTRVAELALALEALDAVPVEFSVVTRDPEIPAAQSLFAAGRAIYEPRKALHYEMPGRYPDLGRPAMFVCTENACSSPVFDGTGIAQVAARFVASDASNGCAE